MGLGHFITRADLDKSRNLKMGDVMSMVPGAGVARGRSSGAWLLSKRYVVPLNGRESGSIYVPDAAEAPSSPSSTRFLSRSVCKRPRNHVPQFDKPL